MIEKESIENKNDFVEMFCSSSAPLSRRSGPVSRPSVRGIVMRAQFTAVVVNPLGIRSLW